MKIKSSFVWATEQEIRVNILFDRKEWNLGVKAVNGKLVGGFMGVVTAQLKYHDYSAAVRKKNFEIIRKHVEAGLLKQKIAKEI